MTSRDGNGWVRCALGHRHWGLFGAAGLLVYAGSGGPVLLQQRTWWSHHGGTWSLPGGARDSHESAVTAALREAAEECGVPPDLIRPCGVFTDDHGGWSYTTVLACSADAFSVQSDHHETADIAWVQLAEVTSKGLHPGFAEHWPRLQKVLDPLTVIVDGANVMGSRPDGWWRDRAGAALRLRDQLADLARGGLDRLPGSAEVAGAIGATVAAHGPGGDRSVRLRMTWLPDIVLVVEGAARPAASAVSDNGGRVRVVAADGSGDDAIALLAAQTAGHRIVVTADRELRRRCQDAGASVAGPSWLLGLF
jgi:8-oxo-dGTP diphosphatase